MFNTVTDQQTVRLRSDFDVKIIQSAQQHIDREKLIGRLLRKTEDAFFLQFKRIDHIIFRAVCSFL